MEARRGSVQIAVFSALRLALSDALADVLAAAFVVVAIDVAAQATTCCPVLDESTVLGTAYLHSAHAHCRLLRPRAEMPDLVDRGRAHHLQT